MTTLELTISSDYVRSWGPWEAIRELLQNAYDAADKNGGDVRVKYTKGGSLIIESTAGDITRDTLLLGVTSKAHDDTQRGQFGEGYKLAMMVLCRAGRKVRVHTRTESWTPSIESSDKFGGADLLKLNIRPRTTEGSVKWIIDNVNPNDWESVQDNCLMLRKPKGEVIDVHNGHILRDEKYAGKLYVRGLFVGNLPDGYRWGYDLHSVRLDRDRKMADPWSLRYAVAVAVESALTRKSVEVSDVIELFRSNSGEGKALREYSFAVTGIAQDLTAEFTREHGEEAVPCTDMEQAVMARQHGLKSVMVPEGQKVLLEQKLGTFEARLQDRGLSVKRHVQPDELTDEQVDLILRSSRLLSKHCDQKVNIAVVEFVSDTVNGTHHVTSEGESQICVARRLLGDPKELWATLIHEAAHIYGGDGSVEHRRGIEELASRIILGLLR